MYPCRCIGTSLYWMAHGTLASMLQQPVEVLYLARNPVSEVCHRQEEKENGISKANNFCFRLPAHWPTFPGLHPVLSALPSLLPPPYLLFIRLAPTAAIPSRASAPIRPLCHGSRSPVYSLLLIEPQVSFHFHHHLRSPVSFGYATRYARGPVLPELRGRTSSLLLHHWLRLPYPPAASTVSLRRIPDSLRHNFQGR